ncbi:MAG: hypothetical protein MI892_21180 [Desulfobacterales bacterium]|nr:hypothetical protein [Desulfobacterales bacterium]
MILHDFTYEWDGKSHDGKPPIAWWPGAYRVKIVKLGDDSGGIKYLFPIAVIVKGIKTKKFVNTSLKNYIHNFAEKMSEAYDLDINKTLWVEVRDQIRVAHLNPDRKLHGKPLFAFSWRQIRPNEMEMISDYLDDFK